MIFTKYVPEVVQWEIPARLAQFPLASPGRTPVGDIILPHLHEAHLGSDQKPDLLKHTETLASFNRPSANVKIVLPTHAISHSIKPPEMTDGPSEHTSLLRPAEVNSDYHPENTNNVSFYSAVVIFFLANAGLGAAVPPTTSILQDIICASHYATQPQGVEIDCQAGPIQAKLTMIKGLASLLLLLPGIYIESSNS